MYRDEIDISRVPTHIANIMDGNGRWAKAHGKPRTYGHQAGVDSVHKVAEEASRLGVKWLTLYTFSTENWNRPAEEVGALMNLLFDSLEEEIFMKNNISFRVVGQMEKLPPQVQKRIGECIDNTSHNTGMCMTLAISYSSKWEITRAARRIAEEVRDGQLKPDDITEQTVDKHLATDYMPDPDLLIRTGGELRLSNYMLWQCAYSELYFCDTYWPDFDEEELCKAVCDFQKRERRYGKTSEQILK